MGQGKRAKADQPKRQTTLFANTAEGRGALEADESEDNTAAADGGGMCLGKNNVPP